MDNKTIQNILNKYGFQAGPADGIIGGNTKAAVARFQTAYNVRHLTIDAQPGPDTQAALADLDASGGQFSAHFNYNEVKCKHCGLAFMNRNLFVRMERLREITGKPVKVVSAYRCQAHNARVKGAPNSQHIFGTAFDVVKGAYNMTNVRQAGFTGVGLDASGRIDHLDIRPGLMVTFPDPGSG